MLQAEAAGISHMVRKHAGLTVWTLTYIVLQLSIDRELVATWRMRDQAKDAWCVSSTCVSSQRTCFAIELCFIW